MPFDPLYSKVNNVHYTSPVLRSKPSLKFDNSTSDVNALIMANGIYDRYDMDWYKKFNRFGIIDPYNAMTTTKEYIFITKPDLCLLMNDRIHPLLENNTFFISAIDRYYPVARQLQSSASEDDGPFMTMLSNSLTSGLDLPDLNSESVETAANIIGTKISYRGTSIQSDQDHDFNLEFEDTKYLDIYMLFKMYDEYEKLKWNGELRFNNDNSQRWVNYIVNHVLHDQVSIYKFVVGEDGSRIVYFARITGCYPTGAPRGSLSDMNNNDTQKLTVGWKGHFVRDMDPIIINHFNTLVHNKVKSSDQDLPIYNINTHSVDGRWASTPYIETRLISDSKRNSKYEYFLKWKV